MRGRRDGALGLPGCGPAQRALIVRERENEREAALVRWGLLPHWAKDERIAFKMINARSETLAEKRWPRNQRSAR